MENQYKRFFKSVIQKSGGGEYTPIGRKRSIVNESRPLLKTNIMKVSDCCGAASFDLEDFGICSSCHEHCEYIDDSDFDELHFNNQLEDEYYRDHPDYLKVASKTKQPVL